MRLNGSGYLPGIVTMALLYAFCGRCRRTASLAACPLIAIVLACGLMVVLSGVAQATTFTYNFDGLTGSSSPGTALATQDNWKTSSGTNGRVLNDLATFSGASGNIAYNGAAGPGGQNSRINDGNFSYTLANAPFDLTFKARRNTTTNLRDWFALGADANSSGTLGDAIGEIGPVFGWTAGSFNIRAANNGLVTSVASGLATDAIGLELVLRVDPSANAGNGAGSFYYRSLAAPYPSNSLIAVAGLQNINLGMLSMAAGFQTPSTWDGLYIRLEAGGALDDLTISQVPEPGAMVLGLLGFVGLAFVALRKKFRRV